MPREGKVRGLNVSPSANVFCSSCTVGKLTKALIPMHSSSALMKALKVIHSVVSGPLGVLFKVFAWYFESFIYKFSK